MNSSKVYRVFTSVGVGTTFHLPDGWKITDFVVTDPRSFHAESNGNIGIVTPPGHPQGYFGDLHRERPAVRLQSLFRTLFHKGRARSYSTGEAVLPDVTRVLSFSMFG